MGGKKRLENIKNKISDSSMSPSEVTEQSSEVTADNTKENDVLFLKFANGGNLTIGMFNENSFDSIPNDLNNLISDIDIGVKILESLSLIQPNISAISLSVIDTQKSLIKVISDEGKKEILINSGKILIRKAIFDIANFINQTKSLNIPTDDIKNILKGLDEVFPDINVSKYYLEFNSKALKQRLNYMVSGPAITSGVKALRDPNWDKNTKGEAYYTHSKYDKPNCKITHYLKDWSKEELAYLPHSEAIQILEKFGVYPALLHLIFAVHFYSNSNPTQTELKLKGTDLIKDLGFDKRTDLSIHDKLIKVNEILTAVKSLIIEAQWESDLTEGKGKRSKKVTRTVTVDPCIMWNIASSRIVDKDLFDNEELKEIEIIVKSGAWLSVFFNKSGRELKKALFNFATLSRQILELDPYREELALRIALLQSTMNYREFISVESWLIENMLGAKNAIAEAKEKSYKRQDLIDKWNNCLISLEKIGCTIIYDDNYPEELRPNFKGKRPRGYLDKILEAKVKLTFEELGKPKELEITSTPIKSDPVNGVTLNPIIDVKSTSVKVEKIYSGSDLKKIRESLGVTQPMVAKYLKTNKMAISRIEKNPNLTKSKYNDILEAIKFVSKHKSKFQ
jgi:DNA-binding transcriptional regulator YiaG